MGIYKQTDKVCVYVVSDGESIKIGRSKHVATRIEQLQTSNARLLSVLFVIPCSCPQQAISRERQIHRSAKRQHIRGEWFTKDVLENKYLNRYRRKHETKTTTTPDRRTHDLFAARH